MPKFFVDKCQVLSNNITVTGDDVNHISRVLRMQSGDELTVCDKDGMDYFCEIEKITKEEVSLINEFLDMSLTTESVQALVIENTVTHNALYDSLAKIVKLFVTADSTFGVKDGSVSLMFIEFLNKMAVEFISADGKCGGFHQLLLQELYSLHSQRHQMPPA